MVIQAESDSCPSICHAQGMVVTEHLEQPTMSEYGLFRPENGKMPWWPRRHGLDQ